MTLRERILAVDRGQFPDVAPFMLDLSHWFYHQHQMPWDLSVAYQDSERELMDYHRMVEAGFKCETSPRSFRWLSAHIPSLKPAMEKTAAKDNLACYHVNSQPEPDNRATAWLLEPEAARKQRTAAIT